MGTEFASANLTAGQLNAIVEKLGGHDRALRFLRDELSVSEPTHSWREEDGVIYFSVTSDGTTGEGWIERLEDKGFHMNAQAVQVLRSPSFVPTKDLTIEVAVLKGILFKDNDRTTRNVRAEGALRKLSKPNAEVACLILEKFEYADMEAMGLWHIIAMHKSASDSDGVRYLLGARCYDRWLSACHVRSGGRGKWDHGYGFAFVVSQVQTTAP